MKHGGCLVERDMDMLRKSRSPIKCVGTSNAGPSLITVHWELTRLSCVKIYIYIYLTNPKTNLHLAGFFLSSAARLVLLCDLFKDVEPLLDLVCSLMCTTRISCLPYNTLSRSSAVKLYVFGRLCCGPWWYRYGWKRECGATCLSNIALLLGATEVMGMGPRMAAAAIGCVQWVAGVGGAGLVTDVGGGGNICY